MRKIILAALLSAALVQTAQAAWLSDYLYRSEVVIDTTNATGIYGAAKTNFPLLLTLTEADSTIFALARFDGSDVRFTKTGGDTLLTYELVEWSMELLHAEFWVKIPALGDQRNKLWIYYGKSGVESASNPAGVFADYAAVLHYNHSPDIGRLLDSSPNDLDIDTVTSGPSWNRASPIGPLLSPSTGRAWRYDTGETTNTMDLNIWQRQWTVQAWVFQLEDGTNFLTQGGDPWHHLAASDDNDNDMQYSSWSGGNLHFHDGLVTPNAWHFMAFQMVASGDSVRAFLDGTMDATATVMAGPVTRHGLGTGGEPFGLGSTQYVQPTCTDCMNGFVDELRIRAGTPLTVGWLKTEHNNQRTPLVFYAIGSLQTNACE